MAKPVSEIKDIMFRVKNCSVYQVRLFRPFDRLTLLLSRFKAPL